MRPGLLKVLLKWGALEVVVLMSDLQVTLAARDTEENDMDERRAQTDELSSNQDLRRRLAENIKDHERNTNLDGNLYNYGTILTIVFASTATLLPVDLLSCGWFMWGSKLLTGITALWIGIERVLNFGGRWQFHIEMSHGYQSVLDTLDLLPSIDDEEERREAVASIRSDLRWLRKRAGQIPGGKKERTEAS